MIPKKESLTVEFKSDIRKLQDSEIFEAVVAFANTDGGDIYLGVENDGSITGVHKSHNNPVTLGAYIANNTVPPISIRTELLDDEKPVLKISVPKSYGGITATASGKILRRRIMLDGQPENIPMYPTELSTRLSSLRLLDYSAMHVDESSIKDFDPLETERLRKTILAYEGDRLLLELPDEDLYRALGFIKTIEGRLVPTITGLLMIGRKSSIETHIPTHMVSFQVLEGTNVKMNEDIIQPLLAVFDTLNIYLDARNPERELEIGMYRMSIPDFNKRAVREAMVNAFCHRDYARLGRVRVSIADEGLTVANPGGFVEGVTANNLLTAEPYGRNPLLADALKRVGLAERTGRGIDRIYEGSLIYGRLPPDYSASTTTTVSLFIPRSAPEPRFSEIISNAQIKLGRPLPVNTLLVLNLLKDISVCSVKQLSAKTCLSDILVSTILENTIKLGIVEARANGKDKKYALSRGKLNGGESPMESNKQNGANRQQYIELILNLASSRAFISRDDVKNLLCINGPYAYRLLKKLTDEGKLESVNKGRHSKYRLI